MLDAARIRAEYRQKKRARLQEEDGGVDASTAPAKAKKRRRATAGSGVGDKATTTTTTIEIRPGESLKHFNRCAFACSLPMREEILPHTLFFFRRVEDHMRPLVRSAMLASAATERKERRSTATAPTVNGTARESKDRKAAAEGTTTTLSTATQHRDRPKEFATTSSAQPRRLNDIATAPPVLKKLPRGASSNLGAKHSARTKAGGVLSMAQRVMMETERENAIRRYREMREHKTKEESEQAPS